MGEARFKMNGSAATAVVFGSVNGLKTDWTKELWESLRPAITKCNVEAELPTTIRIESEGEEAKWISPCVERLTHVLTLAENWDSYGATGVQLNSVLGAIRFLANVMAVETPVPYIGPSRNGNVVLEWHTPKGDLEVEVLSNGNPQPFSAAELPDCDVKIFYSRGIDDTNIDDLVTRDMNVAKTALKELTEDL